MLTKETDTVERQYVGMTDLPPVMRHNYHLFERLMTNGSNAVIAGIAKQILSCEPFNMDSRARSATGFAVPLVTERTPAGQPLLLGVFSPTLLHADCEKANPPIHPRSVFSRRLFIDRKAPDWFKTAVNDSALIATGIQFRIKVTGLLATGNAAFAGPMARDLDHAKIEWARELEARAEFMAKVQAAMSSNDWMEQKRILAHRAYQIYAEAKGGVLIGYDENNLVAVMMKPMQRSTGHLLVLLNGGGEVANFSHAIKVGANSLEQEAMTVVREYHLA